MSIILRWTKHQRQLCWRIYEEAVSLLTQDVLQVAVLEIFDVFVLAEEVLVDVSPSEQPHIRVIGDGPVRVVGPVQCCALSLGLHRRSQERHAKEPQQLLVGEERRQLTSAAFLGSANAARSVGLQFPRLEIPQISFVWRGPISLSA